MSIEQNKETVSQLIEAHYRLAAERVAEILSPKLVWHMAGVDKPLGRDDYLDGLRTGARAFSEVEHRLESLIGEDDRVVVLTHVRMRHTGTFQDLPATNRVIAFSSLWMYKVIDRQVVEIWTFDEDFTTKLR